MLAKSGLPGRCNKRCVLKVLRFAGLLSLLVFLAACGGGDSGVEEAGVPLDPPGEQVDEEAAPSEGAEAVTGTAESQTNDAEPEPADVAAGPATAVSEAATPTPEPSQAEPPTPAGEEAAPATAEPSPESPPAEQIIFNGPYENSYFRGASNAPVIMQDYSDFL
jgi:hypothetical protein